MSRYIDADKLLKNWCESICKPKPNCSDDCFIYSEITNAPSADVTEVILCKDCKYNCFNAKAGIAKCCIFHAKTNLYGFCYLGERRTDETD